jgi:hypothetical protein
MRTLHVLFFGLCLAACRNGDPAPAASEPKPVVRQAPELGPHQSPVSIQLVGPEQVVAGQDIEVVARVERRAGTDAAVALQLELPEGARLVSGDPTEVLPAGNGVVERRFVVHLDRVPSTDIQVVAQTSTTSFGARAKSTYRFGRPEPRFAEPPRGGKDLKVGGRDVGKPIRLQP